MLFKRIALLFATLITILCALPASNIIAVSADEVADSDVTIYQPIEADLLSFNFDYERYCLDKDNYIHPVVVTYKESNTSDYYDLLYVYVRLDPIGKLYPNLEFTSVDVDYYYDDSLPRIYSSVNNEQKTFKVIHSDRFEINENGYIYRLAIDGYGSYRDFNYRLYNFKTLNYLFGTRNHLSIRKSLDVENSYLFDNSNSLIFNNCINILAEDAHCWSYHFDEDNWWENLLDWIGGNRTDILTDQLFYSFYIKNWYVKELKSIDVRYKKVLLDAYRYNEYDTGKDTEFYKGTTGTPFDPKFYLWNESNTKDNYDKSIYLGNSIQQASNSISYTKKTINGDVKNSASTQFKEYEWKSILNKTDFIKTFGTDSDIYKHASNFLTDPLKEYWIINFDEFYYDYKLITFPILYDYGTSQVPTNEAEDARDLINYLNENGIECHYTSAGLATVTNYDFYKFIQEYVFDMTATQMTFVDNKNVEHTLPVSVAPTNEEGSYGGSDRPEIDTDWFLKIIALLFGLLVLVMLFPLITSILTLLVKIITIPFKWIGSLFGKKRK